MRTAYDIETRTLYVDYGYVCYSYENINPITGNAIMTGGNVQSLERVTELYYPVIVVAPKRLHWVEVKNKRIRMYRVESSNIEYVGYDSYNMELYVKFKSGEIYRYSNIPQSLWTGICYAESKGSFLHWWIKINSGTYPYDIVPSTSVILSREYTAVPGTPHPDGYSTGFVKSEPDCDVYLVFKNKLR